MLGVLKINVEFGYLFLTKGKNLCVFHVSYLNYTMKRNGLNETTPLSKRGAWTSFWQKTRIWEASSVHNLLNWFI